jgi:hypothetical protein
MLFAYEKSYITNPPQFIEEFFGYTLEDTARAENIKVYAETCLPGGLICDVSIFENDHYGKTIIFHTELDKVTILVGKLKWIGCLVHGGTTHADTAGCVLVAKNKINNDTIQGSLKDKLREVIEQKISEGYKIKAKFINLDQLS